MSDTSGTKLPPDEFARQLEHFINETLLGGGTAVTRDTRLFEDGYVNSLRILDLIAYVEKALGQRIPDRAVRLANFRSVGTIVQAFHPDASGAETIASPGVADRPFERRRDRTKFASPVDALRARGDVATTDAGQVALSGLALDVLRAVDRTIASWAQSLGAIDRRYPSLIDFATLERTGQVASFPQHLTIATAFCHPRDDRTSATTALTPAVCYHVYPDWEGKTLGLAPTLLTASGHCYRYEGGQHVPLERLWEFTMREVIVLGTREQVESTRRSLVRQTSELVTMLDLDARIELATDPFFTAGDEGRRLMQQAGALKYELQLTVDADGRSVAAASFNHHHDFFGSRFRIRDASGVAANSGCVAFGLERWVLALFAQHGIDERLWPAAARAWVRGARA